MKSLAGVYTALVTPFLKGAVDFESLGRLVDFQVKEGINGFVVHGTTAESPTVSESEKKEVFDFIKKRVPKGFPLIVGSGSNSTALSIQASKEAEKWGADAVLTVVPYYNKPPQRGLVQHFKAIADAVGIPVILYNVPGRTITSMNIETIVELSKHKNIAGIKEATGDIELAKQIRAQCRPDFLLLSGDDGTYAEFLKAGGEGVISVASHVIPGDFARLTSSWKKDKSVIEKYKSRKELIDFLFIEANPIPVKMALKLMGILTSGELRLPLVSLDEKWIPELKAVMKDLIR